MVVKITKVFTFLVQTDTIHCLRENFVDFKAGVDFDKKDVTSLHMEV